MGIGHPKESVVILAELDSGVFQLTFDEAVAIEVIGDGEGQDPTHKAIGPSTSSRM
jgi:hypothetical protein